MLWWWCFKGSTRVIIYDLTYKGRKREIRQTELTLNYVCGTPAACHHLPMLAVISFTCCWLGCFLCCCCCCWVYTIASTKMLLCQAEEQKRAAEPDFQFPAEVCPLGWVAAEYSRVPSRAVFTGLSCSRVCRAELPAEPCRSVWTWTVERCRPLSVGIC